MRGRKGKEKAVVNLTIPPEQKAWLDAMVKNRTFANRSHGVELCILEYRKVHGK